jgi:hypothetical protein
MSRIEHLCRDWPNHWFGYFKSSGHDQLSENLPFLSDFVDPDWHHANKAEILNYLRQCAYGGLPMLPGESKCRCCDQLIPVAEWHWDGEWHWPASLIHYVEAHHVRLPDALIEHMEKNLWNPPSSVLMIPYEQLPMPAAPQVKLRGVRAFLKRAFLLS